MVPGTHLRSLSPSHASRLDLAQRTSLVHNFARRLPVVRKRLVLSYELKSKLSFLLILGFCSLCYSAQSANS